MKTIYHDSGVEDLQAIDREGWPFDLMPEGRTLMELLRIRWISPFGGTKILFYGTVVFTEPSDTAPLGEAAARASLTAIARKPIYHWAVSPQR